MNNQYEDPYLVAGGGWPGVGPPPIDEPGVLPRLWPKRYIVTSGERLIRKFGKEVYKNKILPRLKGLGEIINITSDKWQEVNKAIESRRMLWWDTILIVGGHDVIPFALIENSYGNETIDGRPAVHTDDMYADFDGDNINDISIARIPDGDDLDLLLRQLGSSALPAVKTFGLANAKREYADDIYGIIAHECGILWSRPTDASDIDADDVKVRYVYVMGHGGRDTSAWWGEEPYYPECFNVSLANSRGIIFTGCCYGAYTVGKNPTNSIALSFLKSGAKCFVGCTGTHYSTPENETHYNGPLFHKLFFEGIAVNLSPQVAFGRAKRAYAAGIPHEISPGVYASEELERKILHEFVYYGRY